MEIYTSFHLRSLPAVFFTRKLKVPPNNVSQALRFAPLRKPPPQCSPFLVLPLVTARVRPLSWSCLQLTILFLSFSLLFPFPLPTALTSYFRAIKLEVPFPCHPHVFLSPLYNVAPQFRSSLPFGDGESEAIPGIFPSTHVSNYPV